MIPACHWRPARWAVNGWAPTFPGGRGGWSAVRAEPGRCLLRPTGPLFWSWLLYRLRGKTMALYEVEFDRLGEHGAEKGAEP